MEIDGDVAIIGSGFGGALTALILQKLDLRPVLIDRASHPRFIIGESSTPIADLVWQDLCRRYDLPRLEPLCEYGSWQRSYPQLPCGLKRGFSYYRHQSGAEFAPRIDHANELMVAASNQDVDADTHWYRPDFDAFLVREAIAAHIPVLDLTEITEIVDGEEWRLSGHRAGETVRIRSRFIVDASGEGGFLARHLRLRNEVASMRTSSRSVFGHFRGVGLWEDELRRGKGRIGDYPFRCDDAALHHIVDGGWMYVLRFNNGVTSAGVLLDTERHPLDLGVSPEDEWHSLLGRYPSIARQFADAELTPLCGPMRRTGRLQRRWSRFVGPNWAMLPFSGYGLDALHSTGNAHTLRGIERLCDILAGRFGRDELYADLQKYERTLRGEIDLLDQVVHGCYSAFADFRLFASFSMCYFAGAIFSEDQRRKGKTGAHDAILMADQPAYRQVVDECYHELRRLLSLGRISDGQAEEYRQFVERRIAPYNLAGLCDPARRNLYPYLETAQADVLSEPRPSGSGT
ncbi:MAG: hypothetical protein NT069_24830 [Planctomycetota bacterium]|nr:hypothetical protein [Planctomycetota bacterium]